MMKTLTKATHSDYMADAIAECETESPPAAEYGSARSMDDLQRLIGEWGDEAFGTEDQGHAIVDHLIEEVAELDDSLYGRPPWQVIDEAADCAILLLQLAHRRGFSLRVAVLAKHAVNVKRRWGEPDESGVVRHVEAGQGGGRVSEVPEYIVEHGIVGSGEPTFATYIRKANGSLRRVHSRGWDGEQLPERATRLEALEDLYHWLGQKQVRSTPGTGYDEYGRQAKRVYAELEAEKRLVNERA